MDDKSDNDNKRSDFASGEWALLGYDNVSAQPVIALSPFWRDTPSNKRLEILGGWIVLLQDEAKRLATEGPSDAEG